MDLLRFAATAATKPAPNHYSAPEHGAGGGTYCGDEAALEGSGALCACGPGICGQRVRAAEVDVAQANDHDDDDRRGDGDGDDGDDGDDGIDNGNDLDDGERG